MTDGDVRGAGSIGIVGGGRMGEAIAAGLIGAGALDSASIVVAEPSSERRAALSSSYGLRCVEYGREAADAADTVILAVKPQVVDEVVAGLADSVAGRLVVSIAAGITTGRLESMLPSGTAVVRVMPNTPAMVGQGMSVVSGGSEASVEQVEFVRELFATLGEAIVLLERYQDAAAAVSGCGPAYMAIVVDALARAGVRHGLTREIAQMLATQTMKGTAELLLQTGMHPAELVDGVTSPGGTTIAAVERLEALGLRRALAEAVTAAVDRSKELGS